MKATIMPLITSNPSGLLQLQPSLPADEYREKYGFDLKNVFTIYASRRVHHSGQDWFAFGNKPLEELFTVRAESDGDLLEVFIVETMKDGRIDCHLVLSDEAFKGILNDRTQHLLKVHQMYSQFFRDHIALNMATC